MTKEEIKMLTVGQVIDMPEFKSEMEVQLKMEYDEFIRMTAACEKQGMKLKRGPYQRLRERGDLEADRMVQLYRTVMSKTLVGYSAEERKYISDVGLVVMGRVLRNAGAVDDKGKEVR